MIQLLIPWTMNNLKWIDNQMGYFYEEANLPVIYVASKQISIGRYVSDYILGKYTSGRSLRNLQLPVNVPYVVLQING